MTIVTLCIFKWQKWGVSGVLGLGKEGKKYQGMLMTDASANVHGYRHSNWYSLNPKTVVAKS